MAFLSRFPTPDWLQPVQLTGVMLIQIPMALMGGLFAWAVFSWLRARGPGMVLALSAPWLIYCLADMVMYYQVSQLAPAHTLMLIFAWYKWPSRLAIPLGVWVASRLPQRS